MPSRFFPSLRPNLVQALDSCAPHSDMRRSGAAAMQMLSSRRLCATSGRTCKQRTFLSSGPCSQGPGMCDSMSHLPHARSLVYGKVLPSLWAHP